MSGLVCCANIDHVMFDIYQFWMVVFPEGTRYDPAATDKIQKSQQYAHDQGDLTVIQHYCIW